MAGEGLVCEKKALLLKEVGRALLELAIHPLTGFFDTGNERLAVFASERAETLH